MLDWRGRENFTQIMVLTHTAYSYIFKGKLFYIKIQFKIAKVIRIILVQLITKFSNEKSNLKLEIEDTESKNIEPISETLVATVGTVAPLDML